MIRGCRIKGNVSQTLWFGNEVLDLGENKTELEIDGQFGAASPVMQTQDCLVVGEAEAEALNLPVQLCSNPHL